MKMTSALLAGLAGLLAAGNKRVLILAALGLLATGGFADADTVAYDNATGVSPLQAYGNNLGLDFNVVSPIIVTQLGAFDNGVLDNLNGVNRQGIDVGIFNSSGTLISPTVHFSSSNAGTQVDGNAFLPIAPLTLPVGTYSIVAYNDVNYNSNGSLNSTSTTNDGGGLISFVGVGRFSDAASALAFPNHTDGGPANRYDAGTFTFTATPEPTSLAMLALSATGLIARRRRA